MNSYDTLSPQSRVWIYQSDRAFNENEVIELKQKVNEFTTSWVAHQQALKGWGDILHQRFIVLMVDETDHSASGCSIDSSVHFLKNIEKEYKVNLFDRMNVAYFQGDTIQVAHKARIRELIDDGTLTEDAIIFNNLIATKDDFENNWQIPLKNSWVKQVV